MNREGNMTNRQLTGPATPPAGSPGRGGEPRGTDYPVVIRPRPLSLATLETLVRKNRGLACRLSRNSDQLRGISRVIICNDGEALVRFGGTDALTRHLSVLLRSQLER